MSKDPFIQNVENIKEQAEIVKAQKEIKRLEDVNKCTSLLNDLVNEINDSNSSLNKCIVGELGRGFGIDGFRSIDALRDCFRLIDINKRLDSVSESVSLTYTTTVEGGRLYVGIRR